MKSTSSPSRSNPLGSLPSPNEGVNKNSPSFKITKSEPDNYRNLRDYFATRMASGPAYFDKLPLHVHEEILKNLPMRELKELRLINKKFDKSAQKPMQQKRIQAKEEIDNTAARIFESLYQQYMEPPQGSKTLVPLEAIKTFKAFKKKGFSLDVQYKLVSQISKNLWKSSKCQKGDFNPAIDAHIFEIHRQLLDLILEGAKRQSYYSNLDYNRGHFDKYYETELPIDLIYCSKYCQAYPYDNAPITRFLSHLKNDKKDDFDCLLLYVGPCLPQGYSARINALSKEL